MKKYLFKIMCVILAFGLILPMTGFEISADAAGTYFGFTETFQVDSSLVGTEIGKGYNGWGLTTSSGTQWLDKKIFFNKESNSDNITARFTAEKEHETYENKDRRNRVLNYDLSSVSNSDYFEFMYSIKSTGEPYLFQALVNGLHVGDIDFRNMKIGGKTYSGSADSNGWYNIKVVGNTTGKIYIFVNDVLHLETTNASLTSRASILHLGLISTDCSGADMQVDNVEFNFLTENEYLESAGIVTKANPKVFVIGDSTAADYGTYSENEIAGWAQVLYNYMDDSYMIEDYAEPGASSKSFYNYKWATVIPKVEKGDYVLIQFGHNDDKTTSSSEDGAANVPDPNRYTSPTGSKDTEDSYKWYLNKYVTEVRAKGAQPVFVTSIERRLKAIDKIANPAITGSLDSYMTAMNELAVELNVPVIDLHAESIDLISDYEKKSAGSSANLFMVSVDPASNDNTHLTQKGAMEISKRFCDLLSASDAEILTAFKNHLKDDLDSVVFEKRLFKVEEDFENANLVGTSISNGYNGWAVKYTSPLWADKNISFSQEEDGNIVARFTAAVADTSDATQIDKNRKLATFSYDLSSVSNSDYFQMEYSLKSTGTAQKIELYIGPEIGGVDFNTMKIGGTVYSGAADNDGWYNIKIYGDTTTGKTYYYVNNVLHKTATTNWTGRIGAIQFNLVRTVCSGADIQLDNVMFKFISEDDFCDATGEIPSTLIEPVKFVKSGNTITGLTVKAGHIPSANNKFIIAVYSSQGEFKGARFVTVTGIGENNITLDSPIAYETGDTINVYYWDMTTLKPLSQPYNTLN
ncbi:MAG: hypothetical protein E7406_00715 [Ruminococcaceae bacterium]|nr:hypothetical protein [Oscillospiraceae bacterium]